MRGAGSAEERIGERVGERIGRYRLRRLIGRGGTGAVYEAVHEQIGERVAIKVLHRALGQRADSHVRVFNEARAAHLVGHPGLVRVSDFGHTADGAPYLVMEHLQGESLEERLLRRGRLPVPEAARLAAQVAAALCAAHGRGVVHRDLKPANLFLVPDPEAPGGERLKVLDFGIAKIAPEGAGPGDEPLRVTQSGALLGTPLYMAPEQCRGGREVAAAADVYALGVILYQMVQGRPPFQSDGAGELILLHMTQAPPPLDEGIEGGAGLGALLGQMLAKDPAARPTMSQVGEQLAAPEAVAAVAVIGAPSVPGRAWGGRALVLAGVLVGLILLLAAGRLWQRRGDRGGPPDLGTWRLQ